MNWSEGDEGFEVVNAIRGMVGEVPVPSRDLQTKPVQTFYCSLEENQACRTCALVDTMMQNEELLTIKQQN